MAEAIGTFALAFSVLASLQVEASILATPVIAGLVLGLFVYTIGNISGWHINPAVTIGLWSIGRVNVNDTVMYIIAQLIGAGVALAVASTFFGAVSFGSGPESMTYFAAEAIGAALFTFGIAAVVHNRVKTTAAGLVIGGSLLLGIITAAHLGSAGVLNPAVALAVGTFNFSYILGAIVGGVVGMNVYKHIQ